MGWQHLCSEIEKEAASKVSVLQSPVQGDVSQWACQQSWMQGYVAACRFVVEMPIVAAEKIREHGGGD